MNRDEFKRRRAMDLLRQHPALLNVIFDNAQLNGPTGEKVAVITRTAEIDAQVERVGLKGVDRLSTLVTDILFPIGIDMTRPPASYGNTTTAVKTIIDHPAQLLRLAAELGVTPQSGPFAEHKKDLLASRSAQSASGDRHRN